MSDLYRIVDECTECGTEDGDPDSTCYSRLPHNFIVKAEPCKHGNYAPHICNIRETTKWGELETDWDNCDGIPEASDV